RRGRRRLGAHRRHQYAGTIRQSGQPALQRLVHGVGKRPVLPGAVCTITRGGGGRGKVGIGATAMNNSTTTQQRERPRKSAAFLPWSSVVRELRIPLCARDDSYWSRTGRPLGTDEGITLLMSRAEGSVSDLRNATS